MTKYEARVKTVVGEIILGFDSPEELKSKLGKLDLDSVTVMLSSKFAAIQVREPRQPKPGCENLYRFTPTGKVELLSTPPSEPTTLGLLLYAYDPEPVSVQVILTYGVTAGDYVNQIAYKKYFERVGNDRFVLSYSGRLWVEKEFLSTKHKDPIKSKP